MSYRDDGPAPFMERDTHDAASADTLVEDFGSGKEQEDASLLETTYQTKSTPRRQRLHSSPRSKRLSVALGGFLLAVVLLLGVGTSQPSLLRIGTRVSRKHLKKNSCADARACRSPRILGPDRR